MIAARAAVLILMVAAACGDPLAAAPGRARPPAVGGTIRVQVRLTGAIPALQPLPFDRDQGHCGASRPNPWLRVDASRGLADAVVYLADIPADPVAPTNKQTLKIDHVGCEITPRISIVQPGVTIVLRNSDSILHSTRLRISGTDEMPFGRGLPPAGTPYTERPTRLFDPTFYDLECVDGHPLERGYLIVAAHRWYAITGADGTFVFQGVPPGDHTVKVWHPGWSFTIHKPDGIGRFAPREATAGVTVTAGETVAVTVSVDAS